MRLSLPLLALLCGFGLARPAWADRMVLPEQRTARAWLDFEIRPNNVENDANDVVRVMAGSNPGELVFHARRAGRARVVVRAPMGEGEVVFEVDVLEKNLKSATRVLPDLPPSVRVTVDGPYVILEGLVTDEHEMDQVRALAMQASNVVVAVAQHEDDDARALLVDRRPSEWAGEPRAPDIEAVDSGSFERYRVTLLPGTFVIASHFATSGAEASDRECAEMSTEKRRTLFVGHTPGKATYVVRDSSDRRWIVFDVVVLDAERAAVQRTVPPLPAGVRVSLKDGVVLLEGSVTSELDYGAVEVVRSMFPGAINKVTRVDELPPPARPE